MAYKKVPVYRKNHVYHNHSGVVEVMSDAAFSRRREELAAIEETLPFNSREAEDDVYGAFEDDLGQFLRNVRKKRSRQTIKMQSEPEPEDISFLCTTHVNDAASAKALVAEWEALVKRHTPSWSTVSNLSHWALSGPGRKNYYEAAVADANAQTVKSLERHVTDLLDRGESLAPDTTIVPGVCVATEGRRRGILYHSRRMYAPGDSAGTAPLASSHGDVKHRPTHLRLSPKDTSLCFDGSKQE